MSRGLVEVPDKGFTWTHDLRNIFIKISNKLGDNFSTLKLQFVNIIPRDPSVRVISKQITKILFFLTIMKIS